MKPAAVFVVFASLLILYVEGQGKPSVSRCLCRGPLANMVRLQRVDKIEVYPVSASCESVEIIVTLKNGAGKKCLNPKSEFTQKNIKAILEKKNFRSSTEFKSKRKMKPAAVFVVFASLLILYVEGQGKPSVSRCLCLGPLANMVRLQRVDKIEVYPVSASCESVEIIVTLKNGAGKKCLNPKSEFTQKNIKAILEKNVTLRKDGGQKCLNPESEFTQNYIKRAIKKRVVLKNGAGKKCLNPESKFAKNYVERAMRPNRSQLKKNRAQ
ncbi:C-X-C motif chemokine 11-6 [Bagarius yarrelli]|uniref:C-X-C motif chemokine n=1 Tax=Bagarius yarrelli TaxID=175774 RepID=A0A556U842_BAGYA|nr:C-X-C motif chemokine 11-6 [Bagarius yarrelli]